MSTKERLALILEEAGLTDMAARARAGYYDDYESELVMPCIQLVSDLYAAGRRDLALRARAGEWDATMEESQAWARSPEGQATFRSLLDG